MDRNELNDVRQKSIHGFFTQYAIRRKLMKTTFDETVTSTTPEENDAARKECARHVRPFDQEIATGQIRMLSGMERPTYVLVARRWDERSWLVIPFSDYSNPATEMELKARIDGGVGLRVLQLWNARSLFEESLSKSWIVHAFSDVELEDAVSAWKWSVGVGELTENQIARTGLPIMRRDDPRVEYENYELANFAELDAEDMALANRLSWLAQVGEALKGQSLVPFRESSVFESDYAFAAENSKAPVSANCRVDGLGGVVLVRYVPADTHLMLRVFGLDGNRSQALDGWGVFGKDAKLLGMVEGATFACEVPDGFDGVLTLVDEDGGVHPLRGGDESSES